MLRALDFIRTARRLGAPNLLRVGAYRTMVKAGWYARTLPVGTPAQGPFFRWPTPSHPVAPEGVDGGAWAEDASRVLAGAVPLFSRTWETVGFPPRWHRSVLSGVELSEPLRHWSEIPDFGLPAGDVKGLWEPARFDGLIRLTLGWLGSGNERVQRGIEDWIGGWAIENPPNAGVQWKCAQETSLRLMALLLVVSLLERWSGVRPTQALELLVAQHCERISRTLLYAIAQDNNHGTSEAAALLLGGSFLQRTSGPHVANGASWARSGRSRLEERVARLFMADGSFAQSSVNYHRMAVDTLSLAETWRKRYSLAPFSAFFYERARAATQWLFELTDPQCGGAPNLGANDGSRLFTMHRLPYRDHRPSVQWASTLFMARGSYPPGPWDEPLRWLGLLGQASRTVESTEAESRLMSDGGYARLSVPGAWVLLRLPVHRFRPNHSDALHLDLWVNGENELRDGGSFSYNTDASRWCYYTGVRSHNTIEIDGRDQMPRLSRFLFGAWLEPEELTFDAAGGTCSSSYRDFRGATHSRSVHLEPGRCTVHDRVSGFERAAVLRWRLRPTSWDLAPGVVTGAKLRIAVTADVPFDRFELVEGQESLYYGHESTLPVLEVAVTSAGTIRTEMTWAP